MDSLAPALVAWSVAARTRRGEIESGDGYFIEATAQRALVAVLDGLGHGGPAAAATRTALALVTLHKRESLTAIARRCHEALPETRGGVIGLGLFKGGDDTLSWLGIGNVAGTLLRAKGGSVVLVPRGGLLGRSLPALGPSVMTVSYGDTLIVTTDGVRWRYDDAPIPLDTPERTARRLIADHASGDDDALVVVARYQRGGRAQASTTPRRIA
ncbi:MAG TPA: SpoIIE family protein phosphatase [Candidatus Krumholzibacteria bacterium]|nr:SpoIIE family protein phosphatase [Candidatus Krumholzibacteria bacterium]